jgi:hypothetical protein
MTQHGEDSPPPAQQLQQRPSPSYDITEGTSMSGSNASDAASGTDGKAEKKIRELETGDSSSGDFEERVTAIRFDDQPSIRPIPRTRSLDNINHERAADDSCMYSFRMHHATNDTLSDGALSATEYNFVLDNYIEYNDDTKIPRLRGRATNNRLLEAIHDSHWGVLIAVVTSSCFMTYSLSNYSPFLRADVSQAIVITFLLATFPEVAASSGAGSFAGMVGLEVIPNHGWLTLLALVVSGVWMLFYHYKILVGCGGRLGTCAFISMNITNILFVMSSGTVPWSLYGDASQLWSDRLEIVPSILTVVASTFLSTAGGAVRLKSEFPLNPVAPPTTIALLCMLILEPTGFRYTDQVDAGFAVGSFVAMASYQYLPSVLDFAGAGFTAGLWILVLDPFFLSFGGKKGFTSFCGFATYVALSRMLWGRAEKDK